MPGQFTKDQHQHPRVSLRHFADKPTRDGKVWVFDKQTMRSDPLNPKSIACEEFFYDFPEDGELHPARPQRVERALGKYETLYGSLSRDLIRSLDDLRDTSSWNCRSAIKPEQREKLAELLAKQALRTSEYRASQRLMMEGNAAFLRDTGQRIREAQPRKLGVDQSIIPRTVLFDGNVLHEDDFAYEQHLESTYQAQAMFGKLGDRLADILMNHIWIFGYNDTQHTLYTSDNPVVKRTHNRGRPIAPEGYLLNPGG